MGMTLGEFKSIYSLGEYIHIVYREYNNLYHYEEMRTIRIPVVDLDVNLNYWKADLKYVEKRASFRRWETHKTVNDIYSLTKDSLEIYNEENIEWV
jgi:hypothetical protein